MLIIAVCLPTPPGSHTLYDCLAPRARPFRSIAQTTKLHPDHYTSSETEEIMHSTNNYWQICTNLYTLEFAFQASLQDDSYRRNFRLFLACTAQAADWWGLISISRVMQLPSPNSFRTTSLNDEISSIWLIFSMQKNLIIDEMSLDLRWSAKTLSRSDSKALGAIADA